MGELSRLSAREAIGILQCEVADLEEQAVRLHKRAFALRRVIELLDVGSPVVEKPLAMTVQQILSELTHHQAAVFVPRAALPATMKATTKPKVVTTMDSPRVPTSHLIVGQLKSYPGLS